MHSFWSDGALPSQAVSLESSVCPDLASREHVVGVPDETSQDSAGLSPCPCTYYIYIYVYTHAILIYIYMYTLYIYIYSNLLALRIFQNNTFALRISQHAMQFDLEYSKINVCTQNILALRIFQMLTHIDLKTSFIFSPVLLLQSMHCPNDSNLVSSLNSNVPVPCES